MATINLKGQAIAQTGTRAGMTDPALGQLPIVQTPTSPTASNPNIAPTAGGTGTVQNNLAVNQSTTPEGGFVPMVNTPFTANQTGAMSALSDVPTSNANIDWASKIFQDLGGAGMDMISKGNRTFDEYIPKANEAFNPASYTDYMNPYIESVLNPTLERLRRERDITQNNIGSSASNVGAFGGTREGVQRSLNDEAFDRNTGDVTGQLYYGGFNDAINRAMGQFNTERGRNLQTAQMGQTGATTGATIASNAANNAAGIGQGAINNYRQGALDKLAVGGMEQQLQQKDLDAVNAEIAKQQGFNMSRIKDLLGVLGGLPTSGGASTTKPGMEWTDIIGGGLGAASQYDWSKLFSSTTPPIVGA